MFKSDLGYDYIDLVRNAQQKGASAVIMSDGQCPCDTSKLPSSFVAKNCDPVSCRLSDSPIPYMLPGAGSDDITIPAFMITKLDGQKLRDCFNTAFASGIDGISETGLTCNKNEKISLSADWSIKKAERVEWEVWRSSNPKNMINGEDIFVSNVFANISTLLLRYNAVGSVKMDIINGTSLGCSTKFSDGTYKCKSQCLNAGKYCQSDPDPNADFDKSPNGIDVVLENARQTCLWNSVREKIYADFPNWENYYAKYWRYISMFSSLCTYKRTSTSSDDTKFDYFSASCSEEAHKRTGFAYALTMACVAKGGEVGLNSTNENTILREALQEKKTKAIVNLPSIFVNGDAVRGALSLQNFLSSVCAGMMNPPEFCECIDSQNGSTSDDSIYKTCVIPAIQGTSNPTPSPGTVALSAGDIAAIIIVPFIFSCCCFGCIYRRTRSKLKMEIEEEIINTINKKEKSKRYKLIHLQNDKTADIGIEEENNNNNTTTTTSTPSNTKLQDSASSVQRNEITIA